VNQLPVPLRVQFVVAATADEAESAKAIMASRIAFLLRIWGVRFVFVSDDEFYFVEGFAAARFSKSAKESQVTIAKTFFGI
jgi:hypothetical protein